MRVLVIILLFLLVPAFVADRDVSLRTQTTTVAVSYTHLRAHETVLDLVCRLLLAQKTNNKTHE